MTLGTLLIRADASRDIGTGHVMRCLALAQAWQDRGGSALFVMAESTPAIHARLEQERCRVVPITTVRGSIPDARHTAEIARQFGGEWLVLDGYAFGIDYQRYLEAQVGNLLLIDDLTIGDKYAADIVLNPNLSASREKYLRMGVQARILPGTRYSLLRREFQAWRGWHREIPAHASRILVTLGGSTPEPLARCVLNALSAIAGELSRAVFILGASSSESGWLAAAADKFRGIIEFQRAATDMASVMAEADAAISAAGSTCWELCFFGLPSLVIDVAENQTGEALELHRQGVARYIGRSSSLQADSLAQEVLRLVKSQDIRTEMSSRCRALVDGYGAQRVISAMLNEPPESEHGITQEIGN